MNKQTRSIIRILIFVLTVSFILGCGEDEEIPEPIIQPDIQEITVEDFIGTWEVTSINNLSPELFLESSIGEDSIQLSVEIHNFNYVFSVDNRWSIKLEFDWIYDFIDQGFEIPDGMIQINGMWTGTFSLEKSKLLLTPIESDVDANSDPAELVLRIADVLTKGEAEQRFQMDFNVNILKPFETTSVTLLGNRLTLRNEDGKKLVLKKQ